MELLGEKAQLLAAELAQVESDASAQLRQLQAELDRANAELRDLRGADCLLDRALAGAVSAGVRDSA